MSQNAAARWILAFNSSCQRCSAIAEAVAQASERRLEILPLIHPDVVAWRRKSLGPDPQWIPTLVMVQADAVRAWTGPAMALPLMRRLGLRKTVAVMSELGRLKHEANQAVDPDSHRGLTRKRFLRLGTGAVVATGLLLAGRTPAFAEGASDAARKWIAENKDNLPHNYDDVIAFPMEHRRAIYQNLPQQVRQQLWLDQMSRYRAAHPALTSDQTAVLDTAVAFVARGFVAEKNDFGANERLKESMQAAFGKDEAHALFATLGPDTRPPASVTPQLSSCQCSTWDDLCIGSICYYQAGYSCDRTDLGCGTFWSYHCDGICTIP